MSRFLPKFPIWWQDWLSSPRIAAMTAEQEGGFLRLCLLQWQDGSLPNNDRMLLRMARVSGEPSEHQILLDAFQVCEDGLRRNAKVATVREEADAYCDAMAERGRRANAKRWAAKGIPHGIQHGSQMGSHDDPPLESESEIDLSLKGSTSDGRPKRARAVSRDVTPVTVAHAPSRPAPSRQVTDHWCAAFQASRGSAYVFQRAKDGKAVKDALEAAGGDPVEVCRRIDRAFAHEFWGPKMSGLALFVSRWNDLTESPAEVAARQTAESEATRRRSEAKAKAEKVRSLLPLMEARTPEGLDLIESFRVGGRSQSDAEVVASLKQQIEKAAAL